MTTIDQRILIPAPPDVVWEYLSKIDNNPEWQVNCDSVIFLSQRRNGVGTRWRETHTSRQEYVFEVSTWYDTLGYEYVFIDGPTIQSSKGRLRLQEIPEGTIVQWTYIYEPGGVLGGIRNALTTQRRIESDMVESLKNLWKIVKRMGSMEGYEARSLMRDGPQSPQERAQYQSRHTTESTEKQASDAATDLYARLQKEEPPVSTEDTRPGKAAAAQRESEPAATAHETDFAQDNRFAPTGTDAPVASESPLAPIPINVEPDETRYAPTTPQADDPVPVSEEPSVPIEAMAPPEPVTEQSASAIEETTDEKADDLSPHVPEDKDTSELSIWEVFGIPSPTDSQRMRAIQAGEEAEREYESEQTSADSETASESTPDVQPVESSITLEENEEKPVAAPENTTAQVMPQVPEPEDATIPSRETAANTDNIETGEGRTGLRINARRSMVRVRRPGK